MIFSRKFFLFAVAVLVVLSAGGAVAALSKAGALPEEELAKLQSNPVSLLTMFYDGGPPMAQYVARAVITDPSLVESILSITKTATPQQASAIGAGMARGSRSIGFRKPEAVNHISDKVAESESWWVKITFQAIGPSYKANLVPKIPDVVPMAPQWSKTIGKELSETKSRIGPTDLYLLQRERLLAITKKDAPQEWEIDLLDNAGALTAIIASDAKKNGAVSTSPTR